MMCMKTLLTDVDSKWNLNQLHQRSTLLRVWMLIIMDWIIATNDINASTVEPNTLQSFRESIVLPQMDFVFEV